MSQSDVEQMQALPATPGRAATSSSPRRKQSSPPTAWTRPWRRSLVTPALPSAPCTATSPSAWTCSWPPWTSARKVRRRGHHSPGDGRPVGRVRRLPGEPVRRAGRRQRLQRLPFPPLPRQRRDRAHPRRDVPANRDRSRPRPGSWQGSPRHHPGRHRQPHLVQRPDHRRHQRQGTRQPGDASST